MIVYSCPGVPLFLRDVLHESGAIGGSGLEMYFTTLRTLGILFATMASGHRNVGAVITRSLGVVVGLGGGKSKPLAGSGVCSNRSLSNSSTSKVRAVICEWLRKKGIAAAVQSLQLSNTEASRTALCQLAFGSRLLFPVL